MAADTQKIDGINCLRWTVVVRTFKKNTNINKWKYVKDQEFHDFYIYTI